MLLLLAALPRLKAAAVANDACLGKAKSENTKLCTSLKTPFFTNETPSQPFSCHSIEAFSVMTSQEQVIATARCRL